MTTPADVSQFIGNICSVRYLTHTMVLWHLNVLFRERRLFRGHDKLNDSGPPSYSHFGSLAKCVSRMFCLASPQREDGNRWLSRPIGLGAGRHIVIYLGATAPEGMRSASTCSQFPEPSTSAWLWAVGTFSPRCLVCWGPIVTSSLLPHLILMARMELEREVVPRKCGKPFFDVQSTRRALLLSWKGYNVLCGVGSPRETERYHGGATDAGTAKCCTLRTETRPAG